MNISKYKYISSFFILFVLLFLPLAVFADSQMFNARDTVTLSRDQTVNSDYFAAGKRVIIDGTINGDAYIAGGQIDINGNIAGDLLVAGGSITIRGNVNQIRGAGGNIIIDGTIGKNISVAGGNVMIDKGTKIDGNVVIAAGNSQIAGNILGDVTAGTGALDLAPGTSIQGNLNYWSNNKANIATEASTIKSITFHQTNFRQPMLKERKMLSNANGFFQTLGFVSSLIFGIILIWLFPVYSQKLADTISGKFWLSVLIGLISLIVAPIIIFLLLITLIGIPLAILSAFAYGFTLYVSKLFIALAIGRFIATKGKWKINMVWIFIIGFIIYYLVGIIPIVGALMKLIALLAGMGAIIMQKKYYFSTLRDKKMI
jgi:hypothetical protein